MFSEVDLPGQHGLPSFSMYDSTPPQVEYQEDLLYEHEEGSTDLWMAYQKYQVHGSEEPALESDWNEVMQSIDDFIEFPETT